MPLSPTCVRCPAPVAGDGRRGFTCPDHGPSSHALWRPADAAYEGFADHLRLAGEFPTYLPWPMSPGWTVSDFAVVAPGSDGADGPGGGNGAAATLTCVSGTSELDGPVDVVVVAEEAGIGLGARCAGLVGGDPGPDLGEGRPAVKVRIHSHTVPLWPVSTSASTHEFDRSVFVGEALGRWLWVVLRPASAMLLLRDDWILRDVSGVGAPLVTMPFGGPRPAW